MSAWAAASLALLTVGLGGWSLLDLSERRIRFVSAVTHELRTPMTTLRLYLDMLTGGMVKEEGKKKSTCRRYASRPTGSTGSSATCSISPAWKNQRPRLNKSRVSASKLLQLTSTTWQGRCQDADKELVVEPLPEEAGQLETDAELVQQILGNLIDNACKYSRGADDRHIWVRARAEVGRVIFEVEDRGPGVPARERRSIFRPFRRGEGADVTAGGVGLGLALAQAWAGLLGGRLTLCGSRETAGTASGWNSGRKVGLHASMPKDVSRENHG